MRVLIYSSGQDTGGQGHRIEAAFRRCTDWDVEAHNGSRGSLGFPEHHPLPLVDRRAEIKRLYGLADVVHLRNNLAGWTAFDAGRGKPTIIHYHGTAFREAPAGFARQANAIGAVQVAATLDLTLLARGVEWVPSPYNLAELAALRAPHAGPIRIAHFPTNARVKSTRAFLAATANLAQRYPIKVISNLQRGRVRNMPWAEVLRLKATADIYYDQVILGYGNNAIEAWGMGIPVVAGVADRAVREVMLDRFGHLPFAEATEDTIEHALERLILSREMREDYALRGLEHVTRWHDDAKVVVQLKGIYESAPPTHAAVTLPHAEPAWLVRKQEAQARKVGRVAA